MRLFPSNYPYKVNNAFLYTIRYYDDDISNIMKLFLEGKYCYYFSILIPIFKYSSLLPFVINLFTAWSKGLLTRSKTLVET